MKMGFEKDKRFVSNWKNRPEELSIGGRMHKFRSQLEVRMAKYLQLLKDSGQIKDWFYEQTTFIFDDQIVCKKYIMDFDIRRNDNTFYYIETKGRFDQHTRDRLSVLFAKRPDVEVWMVFQDKKTMQKFLRSRLSRQCKRVCLISEITNGM